MCSNSASKLFQAEWEQFQLISEKRKNMYLRICGSFMPREGGMVFCQVFLLFTVYSYRNPPQNSLVCDRLMLSGVHPYWLK